MADFGKNGIRILSVFLTEVDFRQIAHIATSCKIIVGTPCYAHLKLKSVKFACHLKYFYGNSQVQHCWSTLKNIISTDTDFSKVYKDSFLRDLMNPTKP